MTNLLERFKQSSHLYGGNAAYIEDLYEDWLADPDSVPEAWREQFSQWTAGGPKDASHQQILERFRNLTPRPASDGYSPEQAEKQAAVLKMVNAYRVRGHQKATLDPLQQTVRPPIADLDLSFHGLSQADLKSRFNTGSLAAPAEMTLAEIHALLERVYCRNIGSEYMHITDTEQRQWIQQRLEGTGGGKDYSDEQRMRLLDRLTAADGLERYLHTRYVGQKRFSLEGGDSLIPLLHELVLRAGSMGVKEIVMGMAHRGRLNVLVNIFGKSPQMLFEEFEGKGKVDDDNPFHHGDVKYHLGYSSETDTEGGTVHMALGFNPSHLEIIDPVVVGSARARQDRRLDFEHEQVMPVLIHGDAAFAGQGVVMELFNMSQARGFQVGGTLHVIVNNQIGFTTSNPVDTRSTLYCTEVAKMVQAPIFHVNGDDPEAVLFVTELANDFRLQFKKDVVIDLVCYRRHGHNEADEPSATQPQMYEHIRGRKTTRELYADALINAGITSKAAVQKLADDYRDALDAGKVVADVRTGPFDTKYTVDWAPYQGAQWTDPGKTSVELKQLKPLWETMLTLPEDFKLHNRVQRIMDDRAKMLAGESPMDWGFAEISAYATLLDDGYRVRLVGQDSGRGTFFHRHAVLHDQDEHRAITPLSSLVEDPHGVTIIDSLLSEEAVLGFEYGFASAEPKTLVIWEAQFGDFVNGAQVVIDQFISSGEAKWGRLCGLVMFLPHGYEGQGPEHSSARLERFMQLCAQFNMQVCVPSTPAQMFHMLRRQMIRKFRKPLIVMTPKSLLRNKASTSSLKALTQGQFKVVIGDPKRPEPAKVKRVIFCAGKVFYDLAAERDKRKLDSVTLIRVEQLYPFPREQVMAALSHYDQATEVVWAQEEPMNQGAWFQIKHHLQFCIKDQHQLIYAGRHSSPSPAVGYYALHLKQQQALVDEALSEGKGTPLVVE
ncbi:MAG: 2-oxoglutarate dehydrogenase subunit E1 [Lysobacteraceae bacterium]|nr:MAG: 2-oxoglutarate dehydrogenase subunit E1 [Xanthomonadaceae bacterium]